MHGYMAFDKNGELLVPFRTWRNNITGQAAESLTKLFNFNIPERWSIAHLYQAILNKEDHVKNIDFLTTLAGYVTWKLSGERVLGVGDASGVFPIDEQTTYYEKGMIDKFNSLPEVQQYPWNLTDILPQVLPAGKKAGELNAEGAKLLDQSGQLEAGSLIAPPEGDAGTGMVSTNSVKKRTGNISAGTSAFSMVVLDRPMKAVHRDIDMVTTPEVHQLPWFIPRTAHQISMLGSVCLVNLPRHLGFSLNPMIFTEHCLQNLLKVIRMPVVWLTLLIFQVKTLLRCPKDDHYLFVNRMLN